MTEITLRLREYEDLECANAVAEDIRESGEVYFTSPSGERITAYVAEVSVGVGV